MESRDDQRRGGGNPAPATTYIILSRSGAGYLGSYIFLQSKKHYLQISKVPLKDDDGTVSGIVTVTRDETEVVEHRLKSEQAVKQTVVAMVRAIELRDPYLGGHSRRVAGFAGAIARQMNATPGEISTVEIAANLSQIGKLSISRAILNKPERLTDEEMAEVQSHVEHASSVLRDLDFGLPVFEAIYQMNERLDGAGYPATWRASRFRWKRAFSLSATFSVPASNRVPIARRLRRRKPSISWDRTTPAMMRMSSKRSGRWSIRSPAKSCSIAPALIRICAYVRLLLPGDRGGMGDLSQQLV